MLIFAAFFLLGILAFSSKNYLIISPLEWSLFIALILLIFALFKRYKLGALNVAGFLFGFVWMGIFSNYIIDSKVADIYLNKAILIEGVVADIPATTPKKTKFVFNVEKPFVAKIRLSWYQDRLSTSKNPLPTLKSGEKWQFLVKLKQNNGLQNQGGFDYEKWLFYKQIAATGYIRGYENRLLNANSDFSVNKLRQKIADDLQPFLHNLRFGGIINALIIGDKSKIDKRHRDIFQATNTSHLMVISGLHIGLIAGLVFLLVSFLYRLFGRLCLLAPAQVTAAYFGIVAAFSYALIAGFSIPTERAFIMASVVFISIIIRRHHDSWQLFGTALFLVLLSNPVSIFSVGFWLSFYIVGVIIFGVYVSKNQSSQWSIEHFLDKFKRQKNQQIEDNHTSWWKKLIYLQLLISIAAIPLTAWFFEQGSISSPLANLVAIPLFSFVVVPLALMGAAFVEMGIDFLAVWSFYIVDFALIYLFYYLEFLHDLRFNLWHFSLNSAFELVLFIIAILLLFLPKALQFRKFSVLFLALIFLVPTPKIAENTANITVFDVSQGLAVFVETKNRALLFDTGAGYPSGFNMGDAVINPYLYSRHIKKLDKIIISHGDNDHIGGLKSVLEKFEVGQIMTSVPHKITSSKLCQTGQKWRWDGVLFEIINPTKNTDFKGNNASCVLKVSTPKHSILLTGDIEKKAENTLIRTHFKQLKSSILLSPHHGSQTSSSSKFLQAVMPEFVIISSGFKNRFRHPAKSVTDRYTAENIRIINTNCAGQITINLANKITISKYRQATKRYYMRQCDD